MNQDNKIVINTANLDISNVKTFAQFVAMAKELQGQLDLAWGVVEQQMLDRRVKRLEGEWGSIQFEAAELLAVSDAKLLDPAVTKPALDTKKVRAYRELMGVLPAGVTTRTITKFAKRIKK